MVLPAPGKKESGRRRVTAAKAQSVIASIDSNGVKGLTSSKLTEEVRIMRMEDEINKLRRSHDALSVRNATLGKQIETLQADLLDRDRQIQKLSEFRDMGKKKDLMEAQLHRAIARADRAETYAKEAKQTISDLRAERRRVERGYEKLLASVDAKEEALGAARNEAGRFQSELAAANADLSQLMLRFEHEKTRWQTETMELRAFIEQDRQIKDMLVNRSVMRESEEKDAAARKLLLQWERKEQNLGKTAKKGKPAAGKRTRSAMAPASGADAQQEGGVTGDEKLRLVERAFRRIQEMTGEDDIDMAVEKFVNREQVNSSMMNYVNELTAEQERQQTMISQLRKELAEYKTTDAAAGSLGGKRALALQERMSELETSREKLLKANLKLQKTLASVKTGIASMYAKLPVGSSSRGHGRLSRTGSTNSLSRSLSHSSSMVSLSTASAGSGSDRAATMIDGILTDDNLLQFLGTIEERMSEMADKLTQATVTGAPSTAMLPASAAAPLMSARNTTAAARRQSVLITQVNRKRFADARNAAAAAAAAASSSAATGGDAASTLPAAAVPNATLRLPMPGTGPNGEPASAQVSLSPDALLQNVAFAEKTGVQTVVIGNPNDGPAAMMTGAEFEAWRQAQCKRSISRLARSESTVSLLVKQGIDSTLLPSAADDEDDYEEVEVLSRDDIKAAAARAVADKSQMKKSELERLKRAEAATRVKLAASSGDATSSGMISTGSKPGTSAGPRSSTPSKRRTTIGSAGSGSGGGGGSVSASSKVRGKARAASVSRGSSGDGKTGASPGLALRSQ